MNTSTSRPSTSRPSTVPPFTVPPSTSTQKEQDDFDPYSARRIHPKAYMSTWLVCMLVFKGGFSRMAETAEIFGDSGLLVGTVCVLLLGIVTGHGMHTILWCEYTLCKRNLIPYLSYAEAMKEALKIGPKRTRVMAETMPYVIEVNMIILQWVKSISLLLLLAASLPVAFHANPQFEKGHYHKQKRDPAVPAFLILCMIPLVLVSTIKSWKIIGYMSIYGIVISSICYGLVMYYEISNLPCINIRKAYRSPYKFAVFFSKSSHILEPLGVVLTVEKYMKKPRSLVSRHGLLNVFMGVLTTTAIVYGFLGYWFEGTEINYYKIFYTALPNIRWIVFLFSISYSIGLLIAYLIQMNVAFDIAWKKYLLKWLGYQHAHKLVFEMLFRVCATFITGLIAIQAPSYINNIYETIMTLCISGLLFIFPYMMKICIYWEKGPKNFLSILVVNSMLILLGLHYLVIGICVNILEVIRHS